MAALIIALAVVVGIQPELVLAQDEGNKYSDCLAKLTRFNLYNACRPIELLVESPSEGSKAEGITEDLLRWAAESRLRAFRLYTESSAEAGNTILYVRGGLNRGDVELQVDYLKLIHDPESGRKLSTSLWSRRFTYSGWIWHAKTASEELSKMVDKFLMEYLRVNENHCPW